MPHIKAQLQVAQFVPIYREAQTQTKTFKRDSTFRSQAKIELKKISSPSENKKYATAQTTTTMTVKLNNANGLQARPTAHLPLTAVWLNGR